MALKYKLCHRNGFLIAVADADPRVSPGCAADMGSWLYHFGQPAVYLKHGLGDTDWTLVGGGGGGVLSIITPPALTADTHNWNPSGLATNDLIRMSATAGNVELTGLMAQPDGTVRRLINIGPDDIKLKKYSGSSSSSNQFAFESDINVKKDMGAIAFYDGTSTKWRSWGEFTP